jgi:peptide/nickel transport system ATP-binding protein
MTPLIEAEALRVTIPTMQGELFPVRGIDLRIAKGETVAIVGESGCGKSLTALSLMGLVPQPGRVDADKLTFQGESLLGIGESAWRRLRGPRIAMIFQDPMTSLDPCYTIGSQMVEVMHSHMRLGAREAHERAVTLLARVGIPSPAARLEQFPHQLSGGLRQRVMIAMALSCEPDLIIADEPTTALDVTTQAQILALLERLRAETKLTIVYISHDLSVVRSFCHTVAVFQRGRIVERGPVEVVLSQPREAYTRLLLASVPRLDAFAA